MAIDRDALPSVGFLLTLTARSTAWSDRDGPAFKIALANYSKRLHRLGCVCSTGVIELQENGTPHAHILAFFPDDTPDPIALGAKLVRNWLDLSRQWDTELAGQDVKIVDGPGIGLPLYLAKHSARSVRHAQRDRPMPSGIGRVNWSRGTWPVLEERVEVMPAVWFAFRRMIRAAVMDEARRRGDGKALEGARRMLHLRCSSKLLPSERKYLSERVGLKRWLAGSVVRRLLEQALSNATHDRDYLRQLSKRSVAERDDLKVLYAAALATPSSPVRVAMPDAHRDGAKRPIRARLVSPRTSRPTGLAKA